MKIVTKCFQVGFDALKDFSSIEERFTWNYPIHLDDDKVIGEMSMTGKVMLMIKLSQ